MKAFGFDARVSRLALEKLWPPERREQYLINPACRQPLSVDFISWPSLFDNEQIGAGLTPAHKAELGLSRIPIPIPLGNDFPFWHDLNELLHYVPSEGELVEVIRTDDAAEGIPKPKHTEWKFEGFDVADEGFNSALTNTFCPSFTKLWKRRWVPKLNQNGLFMSPGDAFDFVCSVEELKSEILPLRPYGLYTRPPLQQTVL